jgi:hypothetical protein
MTVKKRVAVWQLAFWIIIVAAIACGRRNDDY